MRSVTEFPTHKLVEGIKIKTALAAEGKTAEEIQQNIGEKFKYEGDKLKYFLNAIECANQNMEKLSRVLVVALSEGEKAPPKAIQVDEMHYVPDFSVAPGVAMMKKPSPGGGGKGKGKGRGPKESPWGLSPEELAAKKGGNKAAKTDKPS